VLTTVGGYTDVPIGLLRFGQIVNGVNQPGVNQVTTVAVVQFTPQPICNTPGCPGYCDVNPCALVSPCDPWLCHTSERPHRGPAQAAINEPKPKDRPPSTGAAQTLSFKAMYPIVLVHGWRGGPWNWESPTANPRVCPADKKNPSDGGPDFVQTLKDERVPFDCSIIINKQASIDEGAAMLSLKLPAILSSFGVRHVHLVSHSKGGLFSREFLQQNATSDPTTQIGVISLTTLETPHHGSVLSDIVVAFREDPSVLPLLTRINPLYYFLTTISFFGRGNDDMTVSAVSQGFNDTYLQPPPQFMLIDTSSPPNVFFTKPFYYSTSSDADIDGDGIITAPEALPDTSSTKIFAHNWTYQRLGTVRAINRSSAPGHWTPDPAPAGTFYKNDTAVTVDSSQYFKFTELGPYEGASGRNHTTIRNPDIAQTVLLNIRDAESKQPAQ
jgi:hypothetical protein